MVAELPNVYFVGNCSKFATSVLKGANSLTRVLCLPEWSSTKQLCLLEATSLEVTVINFE